MQRLLARTIVIVALVTMVTSGPVAARQGPAPVVSAPLDLGPGYVSHVSQSGVVAGMNSESGNHAFAWTEALGIVQLSFGDESDSFIVDVTDSGIVMGRYYDYGSSMGSGFIWTPTGGLVDMGLLPGSSSCQPFDVNNAGEAVGSCDVGNGVRRPFIWRTGTGMEDIGGPVPSSEAAAVNDAGQVFGRRMADGTSHAVRWTVAGDILDLPEPSGTVRSEVLAVNNAGMAVGQLLRELYGYRPFVWSEALGTIDLSSLPGGEDWEFPNQRITSEGLVDGYTFDFLNFQERLFAWSPTTGVVPLPDNSRIYQTNRGYAVGYKNFVAFVWSIAGGFVDLGLSSGFSDSEVSAVNGLGLAAGVERRPGSPFLEYQAFIWTAAHGRVNFGSLGPEWWRVYAINDSGLMGGYRLTADGQVRATLWTVSYSEPPQPNEAPTPAGTGVTINMIATLPGGTPAPVAMTFANVTTAGTTSVETSTSGPALPEGFKLGDPPVYYDVETTAVFAGEVALCFTWQEGQLANEATARLLHFENGAWLDVTTTLDTNGNRVCGQVTSLSPFVVAEAAYTFGGFDQPLFADGSTAVQLGSPGRIIPVKFSITRFGEPVVDATATIAVYRVLNLATGTIDPTNLVGGTGNQFRHMDAGKYGFSLSTKGWTSPATYRIVVTLSDGSMHTAHFSLR